MDVEFRVTSDRREGLLLALGQVVIACGFSLVRQRMVAATCPPPADHRSTAHRVMMMKTKCRCIQSSLPDWKKIHCPLFVTSIFPSDVFP